MRKLKVFKTILWLMNSCTEVFTYICIVRAEKIMMSGMSWYKRGENYNYKCLGHKKRFSIPLFREGYPLYHASHRLLIKLTRKTYFRYLSCGDMRTMTTMWSPMMSLSSGLRNLWSLMILWSPWNWLSQVVSQTHSPNE